MTPWARWDGDLRGSGVGDASAAAPGLRELLDLSTRPKWVAERPDVHLEDHVREAAAASGLTITATRTADDGRFEVDVAHESLLNKRGVRTAAWVVIGAFAEATTHVREVTREAGTEFHIVTGVPDDAGGFAAHGHYVVLRVALDE